MVLRFADFSMQAGWDSKVAAPLLGRPYARVPPSTGTVKNGDCTKRRAANFFVHRSHVRRAADCPRLFHSPTGGGELSRCYVLSEPLISRAVSNARVEGDLP